MNIFWICLFSVLTAGALFCFMMAARAHFVYEARMKAWDSGMDADAAGTFDEMMWKLTKWTFKSFYPRAKTQSPGA